MSTTGNDSYGSYRPAYTGLSSTARYLSRSIPVSVLTSPHNLHASSSLPITPIVLVLMLSCLVSLTATITNTLSDLVVQKNVFCFLTAIIVLVKLAFS